jgi:hypothetical protein
LYCSRLLIYWLNCTPEVFEQTISSSSEPLKMADRVVSYKHFWSIFPGCRCVRHYWTTALWVCYFAVCSPHYIRHSGIQWRKRISPLQQDHCLQLEQMQSGECNALSVIWRCVCQLSANCDRKVQYFVHKLVTCTTEILSINQLLN